MTMIETAMLALYALGMVAAGPRPRELAWLCVGAGVFLSTSMFVRAGGDVSFSALADAAVCLSVYAFGRYMWELAVWRLFQSFVLVHILYIAGQNGLSVEISPTLYAVSLEAINVLIVLTIGGTGILKRIGYDGFPNIAWRPVRRFVHFVCAERARPPFWAAG